MFRFLSLLCLIMLLWNNATAQECYPTDPEFVAQVAQAKDGQRKCAIKCQGCGCKGGPGYRNRKDGECVGWDSVRQVCGTPYEQHCTRECTPVAVGCETPSDAIERFQAEKAAEAIEVGS